VVVDAATRLNGVAFEWLYSSNMYDTAVKSDAVWLAI
jgi:hypothetical protein